MMMKSRAAVASRRTTVKVAASGGRREAFLGFAGLVAATVLAPAANAGVTEDLLAKSTANKALNDKKRLATSSANVARSRTVADGTCGFPTNFFGCEPASNKLGSNKVKFITDDYELECQGKEKGKCASRAVGFLDKY